MPPLVSVIMGVYNCSETLSESIESIIQQSYPHWELVICDDASTDATLDIAQRYARRYPGKIRVVRNAQNMRLAYSLNHCLQHANGEFIARMDGDDLSVPQRFAKQVAFLTAHPEYDLVGTSMIAFSAEGELGQRTMKPEPTKYDVTHGNPFAHATIMIRAASLRQLGAYRVNRLTRRMEDVDLFFRFMAAGMRGYNLAEGLYRVREDATAFTRRKLSYSFDAARLCIIGYRLLKLPWYSYLFAFKPIIAGLTPNAVMRRYHQHRLRLSACPGVLLWSDQSVKSAHHVVGKSERQSCESKPYPDTHSPRGKRY